MDGISRDCRVLVALLLPDTPEAETLRQALVSCAALERRGPILQFEHCASLEAALALASRSGELQAVVVDSDAVRASHEALAALRMRRPELDLFLMTGGAPGEDCPGRVALLDRRELRPEHLCRQLRNALGRRARTPFADTLKDYVYSARDAWHTPGHSGGDSLRDSPWVSDFYQFMGEHIFNTDLSVSVQSLDSLLEPHSVIHEAQVLAAEAFGARHSFFLTNGTSTANKVILQQLVGNGGKVIVDQACHKSIHHAVVLFGAQPVYLAASVNPRYGFYGPVPRQRISAALAAHPDARLLVLTICTYDGFRYDLKPIIAEAHAAGVKVLVDEAWYAHGAFHPELRPTALECGADYVSQSTHKMLSAFSQASMIHVGDPDFDEHRFRENLNMHMSTSPQYAMIASLDVARKQMSLEGFSLLQRAFDLARRLREGIQRSGVFRVLELGDMLPAEILDDGIRLDPCKVSVDVSGSGLGAREIQLRLFNEAGIQVEKTTHNTLSLLVTPGTTESKLLRLLQAFGRLAADAPGPAGRPQAEEGPPPLPPLSPVVMPPREAYFGASSLLPLGDVRQGPNPALEQAVAADQIVPYPPGIPVLVPGQRITRDILGFLHALQHSRRGVEIHGLVQQGHKAPALRVVAPAADSAIPTSKEKA